MPSQLERQWWFIAPVSALAVLLTMYVMRSAGIVHPYNIAQWILYILCAVGLQRGLSLAGWLLALWVAPSSALLKNTR
jgi:hypothetical protein